MTPALVLLLVFAGLVGLAIGSFLNVVIHRVPKGLPLTTGSACPRCGAAVRKRDNIPLLSWIVLRGRCRDCRERIPVRYPLVEAFTAVAFVLVGLFVYLAENLTTFFGAWEYPHQAGGWQPVHLAKIGSWSLLVILSFILVAFLKQVKRTMPPAAGGAGKAQSRGERR